MSLEYDDDYRFDCKLVLDSGRPVFVEALFQWTTYAALQEGIPWREFNDERVEKDLRRARRHCLRYTRRYRVREIARHLIPPRRRDYMCVPGDMEGNGRTFPEVPEWLPMVACSTVLKSLLPARDKRQGWSLLAVSWYQDAFALPIERSVLDQLRALPWDDLAIELKP